MANKRTLKHTISFVCEELLAECIAASLYGHNKDGAESLIYSVFKMQDNYLRRVSHPEPGLKPRQYYKDLRERFAEQVNELVDQLNNL